MKGRRIITTLVIATAIIITGITVSCNNNTEPSFFARKENPYTSKLAQELGLTTNAR